MRISHFVFPVLLVLLVKTVSAISQPYPQGTLNADQIAEQVFLVSHGKLLESSSSTKKKKNISLVVTRAPEKKRKPGRKPTVNTFETYGKSRPEDPLLDSLQMAIITSGKIKGTGTLYTNYKAPDKGDVISLWLPALRKLRRINEPAHDDKWIGSNLTYGELVLRRPEHEKHELLAEGKLNDCLLAMELQPWEVNRYTKRLPEPACSHQGKPVYRLKSTTKFKNWWYDYHVSDIDKKTFGIYRTVYYKKGEKIKTITVDWQSLGQDDPRIIFPRYIYAVSHLDGSDTMIYVPLETISVNPEIPDSFWSEESLKRLGNKY